MSGTLPRHIGAIRVSRDSISAATWDWAQRSLPAYLLTHSVRAYAWGAVLGRDEGLTHDQVVLWTASLMHDVGLTHIPRNSRCFEFQGAAIARRFLVHQGMPADEADRAALAIQLHMASGVTLKDGVESVLLDRATAIDVRGNEFERIEADRASVMSAFPRGPFDRHFLAAIQREVALRPGCQSERLLKPGDLAGRMARSPWRGDPTSRR